jgi:hypothetical protein
MDRGWLADNATYSMLDGKLFEKGAPDYGRLSAGADDDAADHSIVRTLCARAGGFRPRETRTSTCRNFATISSGLYRFLAITVLLDVKDILQVGPLEWERIISD